MKGGAVRSRNEVTNELLNLEKAVRMLQIKEVLARDYTGQMIIGKTVKKHKVNTLLLPSG